MSDVIFYALGSLLLVASIAGVIYGVRVAATSGPLSEEHDSANLLIAVGVGGVWLSIWVIGLTNILSIK